MRIKATLFAALCFASLAHAAGQARSTLTVSATLLAPTCLEAPGYKDCIPHIETRQSVINRSVAGPSSEPGASDTTRAIEGPTTIVTITY